MGLANVETVTTAAFSYDLTDLETVKDELSIDSSDTSNDIWLGRAISQISAAVKSRCNQPQVVEAVLNTIDIEQDPYPYQTPGGVNPLQLSRFPVISVGQVQQTLAINSTQSLVAGTDYRIDQKNGQLIRLNPFSGVATNWEAIPVSVPFVAGWGALATESYTVPASPFQIMVKNSSAFSIDQGVTYANGTKLVAVASSPSVGQYISDGGEYTFAAGDFGASIAISCGYNTIPDDLVDVVLRMITQRWGAKGRDPMLMARNQPGAIGEERYWIDRQNGPFPPEIAGLLDGIYRVPVIA